MKYAVFQIGSRQYFARPKEVINIDKLLGEQKTLSVDQVMLIADEDKLEIGKPYLKKTLNFEVLGNVKQPKVRVATYKAKSNYRRVRGQRAKVSRIRLLDAKDVKKA